MTEVRPDAQIIGGDAFQNLPSSEYDYLQGVLRGLGIEVLSIYPAETVDDQAKETKVDAEFTDLNDLYDYAKERGKNQNFAVDTVWALRSNFRRAEEARRVLTGGVRPAWGLRIARSKLMEWAKRDAQFPLQFMASEVEQGEGQHYTKAAPLWRHASNLSLIETGNWFVKEWNETHNLGGDGFGEKKFVFFLEFLNERLDADPPFVIEQTEQTAKNSKLVTVSRGESHE